MSKNEIEEKGIMNSIPVMKENRITKVSRVIIWLFILMLSYLSILNVIQGTIIRPWAFLIVFFGFMLFALGKLSVILKKKKISFGSKLMSENMANIYRLGYWFMIFGLLATFTPI
jgi:hypothetical protein